MAFKTNKKSPNEKSVIGMVKISKTGFRKAFKNDKTSATINAAENPETCTPGTKYATITTEKAVISKRKKKFFI